MQDDEQLVDLLGRLVAINSVNPSLAKEGHGEQELGQFVATWLTNQGLDVSFQQTGLQQRPNVIAVAHGTGSGRSLLLNAHLDTVGVEGMEDPFGATVKDGHLYGRGALDTKAGLAIAMQAVVQAQQQSLCGDVILAAVVDEEYASHGTEELVRHCHADAAIVMEPTNLSIITAHKGFVWLEVETQGVAAHGSRPDAGVDAIMMMGKVLSALEDIAQHLAASPPHPKLGTGSIHTSLIHGGQEWSSYPAKCQLSIERRTIPGETAEEIANEIRQVLGTISTADPRFQAVVRTAFARDPLDVIPHHPLLEILRRHASKAIGTELAFEGFGGWTDAALLLGKGIPTVVFGPTGDGLHGMVERVDLASVCQCYAALSATVNEFCA